MTNTNANDATAASRSFQVLYFEVNGVTFAAPLVELGGIHPKENLNHLIGKPDWHMGLQNINGKQCSVVDTAKWLMPEREVQASGNDEYQYVIMMGESNLGLACNSLKGTETITEDGVKWNGDNRSSKWSSGLIKEKMCVLLNSNEIVNMIGAGAVVIETIEDLELVAA